MQLAGGRVSALSEGVGQGSTFVLAWPAAGERRHHQAPDAADAGALAEQPARREHS
jgi:hypothetical protein